MQPYFVDGRGIVTEIGAIQRLYYLGRLCEVGKIEKAEAASRCSSSFKKSPALLLPVLHIDRNR